MLSRDPRQPIEPASTAVKKVTTQESAPMRGEEEAEEVVEEGEMTSMEGEIAEEETQNLNSSSHSRQTMDGVMAAVDGETLWKPTTIGTMLLGANSVEILLMIVQWVSAEVEVEAEEAAAIASNVVSQAISLENALTQARTPGNEEDAVVAEAEVETKREE